MRQGGAAAATAGGVIGNSGFEFLQSGAFGWIHIQQLAKSSSDSIGVAGWEQVIVENFDGLVFDTVVVQGMFVPGKFEQDHPRGKLHLPTVVDACVARLTSTSCLSTDLGGCVEDVAEGASTNLGGSICR